MSVRTLGPEPSASTNSATRAIKLNKYIKNMSLSQTECILQAFLQKKQLPAEFRLEKPAASRLNAELPWNYIHCRSRGSNSEFFFNP